MATLVCQAGDPDYLKITLLKNVAKIHDSSYSVKEGKHLHLVLESGYVISSANEICRFLCNEMGGGGEKCFPVGSDLIGEAQVDYWLDWETRELKRAISSSLSSKSLSEELLVCLGRLESHMTTCGGRYILQEGLSLADVVVWSTLYVLLAPEAPTSQSVLKESPLVCRWFISLSKNDPFSAAVWKASNDVGYSAYHTFMMQHGKQSSFSPVSLQHKMSQNQPLSSNHGLSACSKVAGSKSAEEVDIPVKVEEVSRSELDAARENWDKGLSAIPRPIKREHPILPVPGERNILVTSALPYVNNVPHLGNIIGCVLSADVFARYCRLRNYCTLYVCGTDEYGTATETKALEEGLTPQEICQKYHDIHASIYDWFNIKFDCFGRTSTSQQTEISQDIFWRLHERGFICKDTVDQLLCEKCNRFLADRFVEGTCPLCGYEDARGDQCDSCGKLINATELKAPRCKVCSTTPVVKTSKHLFLDLYKLEPEVKKWFKASSDQGLWSSNAEHITASWLRDGLKPRCISRDLKWGTPVPLEGYTDKVFYVWFDAPIGYLSITACYTSEWERWWKNPDQVKLYQFMAKDNVPFHTVVFPCSLIGSRDNYTLLDNISSTDYLNYENTKFSKSRGIGVFGNNARDTNIPADIFRFYLLYIRPETQDSVFSWEDFMTKNNSELLNNLGNFINRVLMFIKNNFDSTIQEIDLLEEDVRLIADVNRELNEYILCLEKMRIRDGLRHILSVSRLGNIYIQANKPWVLVKGTEKERARAGSVLNLAINVVCALSVMVQPYMPLTSKLIQEQIKAPDDCNVLVETLVPFIVPGHKIGTVRNTEYMVARIPARIQSSDKRAAALGEPTPLFNKIEEATIQGLKERFGGRQEMTAPSGQSAAGPVPGPAADTAGLQEQLDKQAALVRELKTEGATKEKVDAEVKKLLALKEKLGISSSNGGKKKKKNKK